MNKKSFFIFLIVVTLFVAFTQNALAYTVATTGNGGTYSGYGPYQTGTGGEFTLQVSSDLEWVLNNYSASTKNLGGTQKTFQTFCIEEAEYIYPNTVYSATISNGAVSGGVSGAISGIDPISIGTAWLYYSFAQGTLSGYDYTDSGRASSAAALQSTIWWLEGEAADPTNTNIFRKAVIEKYGSNAMTDNNGTIPVAVLNLWAEGHAGDLNYRRQDQLIVTHTPVPAAIWLFGAGLLSLVGVRHRFTS